VPSKFALVIANTEYQDASFAKLTAPGKDAEEFAHVLREPELTAFDNVQVLINEGEGKTRRAIARFFADRNRDDLLLLYFSGHGIRNGQGQLFLAANDTEINILEATGIPAEFVTYAMNNSRSQRQLLILDCCNSGAFAHGSKSVSAVGKSMGIAHAFEGSGFGRVVLTATDATQYAWEGENVIGDTQKSVFTHFLIEGLKGDADQNGDGRIDVDELYDYAYEQVVLRTPKQTPGKWSYRQQGDLILRENLKPRQVKPTPLPSDLLELLSYPNFSVRRAAIQELIPFLDGKHLGLARAAEEKLREITTNDTSLDLRKIASDALNAHGLIVESLTSPVEIPQESTPVEKPAPVKSRKKISSKPNKSLEEQNAKPDAIARTQSVAVEIPKQEHRKEKPLPPPRKYPSVDQFSAFIAKMTSAPRKILAERKIAMPKLNKLLLGRILGFSLIIIFLGWAGNAIINIWPTLNSPTVPTSTIASPNATTPIQSSATTTSLPAKTNTALTNTAMIATSCTPPLGWIQFITVTGDTIYSVAQRYKTSAENLSSANCVLSAELPSGFALYVPSVSTVTVIPCGPPVGWVKTYIVQPGDTLFRIALSYGITYNQLQRANCMGSSTIIYSVQRLWVPNIPTRTSIPGVTTIPDFPTETPTPIIAIIRASEGGGAFIRERPGGIVLATLGNGSTVTIIPNDLQEMDNVSFVHVVAIVNNVHIEGWMMKSVLVTATPS
jgi:LysM repeat protein